MYVHWKSLICLGLIFYMVLCTTDILGKRKIFPTEYIVEETVVVKEPEENMQPTDFIWSLMCANTIVFIFSLLFCSFIKFLFETLWHIYGEQSGPVRNKLIWLDLFRRTTQIDKSTSLEFDAVFPPSSPRIPKSRASDSVISVKRKINSDLSCPNLNKFGYGDGTKSTREVQTSSTKQFETLFQNDLFSQSTLTSQLNKPLRSQCARLREELLMVQAKALGEQSLLSRKLETVTKEKRELSKQLSFLHKENRTAKQQLEELLSEKAMLNKRLENATKEFKVNTKTKKVALQKLEEVSTTVDDLKKQLEQVTRDKEILESKLEVLRNEYDKLKERLRYYQVKGTSQGGDHTAAEKDNNNDRSKNDNSSVTASGAKSEFGSDSSSTNINKDFLPFVISQTELDMRKIQKKILQLEKNLENFNPKKPEFESKSEFPAEIDPSLKNSSSLSMDSNYGRNIENLGIPGETTCRKKYEDIKMQMLTNALRDKVKILENIKEKTDDTSAASESESDFYPEAKLSANRIVSNSAAFQQFLRNINTADKRIPSSQKLNL